ncbi:MAG: HD domain-containing protein [Bacilli bacterium]
MKKEISFTKEDLDLFYKIIDSNEFKQLKKYYAHKSISVYEHSINVALESYKFAVTHKMKINHHDLIIGALLHDFYLYDWHNHISRPLGKKLHGYSHPIVALNNASKFVKIDKKISNIIRSHMFPLTLFHFPKCKEAWLVCYFDKIVATNEIRGKDKIYKIKTI